MAIIPVRYVPKMLTRRDKKRQRRELKNLDVLTKAVNTIPENGYPHLKDRQVHM